MAQGLNRTAVIDAAEALVDLDGWRELSMSELSRKLGVRTPSLYSHVENLESLLAEVQIRAHGALADELQRAAMGVSGAAALRSLATALRRFATTHPGLYELAMSEAIDEQACITASEPSGAALRAVIASFGISDRPNDLLIECLAPLHGVIALEHTGFGRHGMNTEQIYERAVDMVLILLEHEGKG